MKRQERIALLVGLVLLGAVAGTVAWYATAWGPWAGSDSAVYITAARNFIAGKGLRVIQPSGKSATLLGPAYPLLLAWLGLLKIAILDAARWLNILLFTATAFLFGFTFYKFSRTPWLAVPAAILVAIFPTMIDLHSGMMTEPLYLWSSFLGLLLLIGYLGDNHRFYLAAAGLLSGLAIITRFIGFSLLPVGILVLLALQGGPVRRRIGDALLFTLVTLLPFTAWYIWFQFNPDASTPLGAPLWTNPYEYLKLLRDGLVNVLWSWVPFSQYIPFGLKIEKYLTLFCLALVLGGLPVWGASRQHGRQAEEWVADTDFRLFSVFTLYILSYLVTFVFFYLFRTPAQDVNERTLLPLFQPVAGILLSGLSILMKAFPTKPTITLLKIITVITVAVGIAAYLPADVRMAIQYHKNGAGYTSASWQASETLHAVEQLPPDVPLISNDTGVIMFYTGRASLEIEELHHAQPLQVYTRYGENPNAPNETLFRQQGAALILWEPSFYWQLFDLYQGKAEQRLEAFINGLTVYGQYTDGAIYFYPVKK